MPWWSSGMRVGPDEEHGTRGVVEDVAGGGPEAVWPGVSVVIIACEHKQVHRLGGRDYLVLDTAGARIEHGIVPEGGLALG